MIRLKQAVAPAVEPISTAEAKAQLRIDFSDDDTYIDNLIKAARTWCELYQNRSYITQTWDIVYDKFPSTPFELPRPPLASVTSIKYYDTDDTENTYSSDNYFVDTYSDRGRVSLNYSTLWPTNTLRPINGVIVRYVAGYGVAADVPLNIKQAILLLVTHWYENRMIIMKEMVIGKETLFTLSSLLDQERVVPI